MHNVKTSPSAFTECSYCPNTVYAFCNCPPLFHHDMWIISLLQLIDYHQGNNTINCLSYTCFEELCLMTIALRERASEWIWSLSNLWKRLDKATLQRQSNLLCLMGTLPDQFLYWLHVVSAENCITTKIYDSGNYRRWPVCFECRWGLSLGIPRFDWEGALKDWCTWYDFVGTFSAHFQGKNMWNPEITVSSVQNCRMILHLGLSVAPAELLI